MECWKKQLNGGAVFTGDVAPLIGTDEEEETSCGAWRITKSDERFSAEMCPKCADHADLAIKRDLDPSRTSIHNLLNLNFQWHDSLKKRMQVKTCKCKTRLIIDKIRKKSNRSETLLTGFTSYWNEWMLIYVLHESQINNNYMLIRSTCNCLFSKLSDVLLVEFFKQELVKCNFINKATDWSLIWQMSNFDICHSNLQWNHCYM